MALSLSTGGQGGVFTLRAGSFGGRFQASVTPPASATLLLDTYPGAVAAYSFRKLRSAYTGPCCQISDGVTLIDIGFVNNYVDLTAIQNAGPNIDIVFWYDQSGNGNDLYRTQGQGGRIKISNVLQTLNGKVAINYISRSASFNNNSINLKNGFCNFTAAQLNSTTQQVYIFSKEISDIVLVASQNTNEWGIARDNVTLIASEATKAPTTYTLFTSYYDGLNGAIKSNGIIRGTGVYSNSTTTNTTQFSMPTNIANGSSTDILYTESVFYQSTQLSNQTGIEANINSYYSIY